VGTYGQEQMMTVAKEMNNGVALLLERMKTHPEEFTEQGKWVTIMQDMHKYASKEESIELNDALKSLMMQKLTERVLEELVDPKKSEKWSKPTVMTSTHSAGVTLAQSTLNALGVGSVTTTAPGRFVELEIEKPKKPKTIFGRLFNYAGENK